MKIVNRKTRKAIRKGVKKAVKKHGPKVAAGLAGGIASALATLASTEAPRTRGRQTNLGKLSEQVSDMVVGESGKKSRKRDSSGNRRGRKIEKKSAKQERVEP